MNSSLAVMAQYWKKDDRNGGSRLSNLHHPGFASFAKPDQKTEGPEGDTEEREEKLGIIPFSPTAQIKEQLGQRVCATPVSSVGRNAHYVPIARS
jgi:hypothetical protein